MPLRTPYAVDVARTIVMIDVVKGEGRWERVNLRQEEKSCCESSETDGQPYSAHNDDKPSHSESKTRRPYRASVAAAVEAAVEPLNADSERTGGRARGIKRHVKERGGTSSRNTQSGNPSSRQPEDRKPNQLKARRFTPRVCLRTMMDNPGRWRFHLE